MTRRRKTTPPPFWAERHSITDVRNADLLYAIEHKDADALDQHRQAHDHQQHVERLQQQAEAFRSSAAGLRATALDVIAVPSTTTSDTEAATVAVIEAEAMADTYADLIADPHSRRGLDAAMAALDSGIKARAVKRGQWAEDITQARTAAKKAGRTPDPLPHVPADLQGITVSEVDHCARWLASLREERDKYRSAIPLDQQMARRNIDKAAQLDAVLALEVDLDPSRVTLGVA